MFLGRLNKGLAKIIGRRLSHTKKGILTPFYTLRLGSGIESKVITCSSCLGPVGGGWVALIIGV